MAVPYPSARAVHRRQQLQAPALGEQQAPARDARAVVAAARAALAEGPEPCPSCSHPMGLPIGRHVIADLYDCPADLLNDLDVVSAAACYAAEASGATILNVHAHQFTPQGVTVLLLLAESHLSVHTWPEHGMAAADLFTCGENTDPEGALSLLAGGLGAERSFYTYLDRMQPFNPEPPPRPRGLRLLRTLLGV